MRKKTVLRIAKLMLALFMFFSGFRLPVIRAEDSLYGELVTDLSTLKDGDRIIIVNKSANMAMSQTASTSNSKFRSGVSVTPTDGMIDNPPDDIIWTLHVVDGGYTFTTADGSKRLSRPDKTQTVLDATSNYYIWAITDVADSDVFYIDNTGPSEKGHYRLHWNTVTDQIWWNVLNEGKTDPEWQQNIYVVRNNTISPPVIETCTVTINDSDNGSISVSNVEDGVAIKGSDIVITAHPDADYELLSLLINEVEHANEFEDNQLTVTVNEDLTIRALFKLIREPVRYITVLPSEHGRVYTDFSVFENDQAMPIYVEPDEGYELTSLLITHGDTTEDIANPPAGVTYGPYELNGKTYYDFTVDWDITIQGIFEKIGSDEPTVSEGLVTDLSQLTDGAHVVIYHQTSTFALTSEVWGNDYYLIGTTVQIQDD
ncbi:MAG: hypothetical protein J5694_03740, partial [Erysipelotrichaceae bacterium]|nr:hypothetical protein [Erysipelotrichaceae bacterium]